VVREEGADIRVREADRSELKICPLCGRDHDELREEMRKARKTRRTVLVSVICIIIILLIVTPMIMDWMRPESVRQLISSDDLGEGWTVGSSFHTSGLIMGSPDCADAHMSYEDGSTYIEGSCCLALFSNHEDAGNAFEEKFNEMLDENYTLVENVTIGERGAYFLNSVSSLEGAWAEMIVVHEGKAVFMIFMHHTSDQSIDHVDLVEIAEVQLLKLR